MYGYIRTLLKRQHNSIQTWLLKFQNCMMMISCFIRYKMFFYAICILYKLMPLVELDNSNKYMKISHHRALEHYR